jgi:hypothetical protein
VPEIMDAVDFFIASQRVDRETVFKHGNPELKELAMWDEIVECEEANKPKPEWARKALVAYAKQRYANIKFDEQHRILDDYARFEAVQRYLKKSHKTKSGKLKPFTLRRACLSVAIDEGKGKRAMEPEVIQHIRRAYERACERNEKGFYSSSLFRKMLSTRTK